MESQYVIHRKHGNINIILEFRLSLRTEECLNGTVVGEVNGFSGNMNARQVSIKSL